MKEFIEFLVKSIVKKPDQVYIEETGEGTNFRYSITVDPEDTGLIIGKGGATINSIRSLAKAKAVKQGIWVAVEITEPVASADHTDTVPTDA